jgi:hypothetical protein
MNIAEIWLGSAIIIGCIMAAKHIGYRAWKTFSPKQPEAL